MDTNTKCFNDHVAHTSGFPMGLEIEKAEGIYLYSPSGKQYLDLASGVSVANIGHGNPEVINAVKAQAEKHMHVMVYGEFIQKPQTRLAGLLTSYLPPELNNVYFVNSGSEAIEGAMKLAKKCTGRYEVIAFNKAYHGGTHGALSILGDESFKQAFRPLLPAINLIDYNDINQLEAITTKTACVIVEPVQAEAGIIFPKNNFLQKLRERCSRTGTMLIFDEVQTAMGRIGKLFGFQRFNVVPDILVLAKALGGGMPLGAFISSKENMKNLQNNPVLGHITTFGGHPVSCAASLAAINVLLNNNIMQDAQEKGKLFKQLLKHPEIKAIRGDGLFLAIVMKHKTDIQKLMMKALDKGIILDGFLFEDNAFRVTPPLIINEEQIHKSARILLDVLDEV